MNYPMRYAERRRQLAESLAAKCHMYPPQVSIGHEEFIQNVRAVIIQWTLPGTPHKRGVVWMPVANDPNVIEHVKNNFRPLARPVIADAFMNRFYLGGPKGFLPK